MRLEAKSVRQAFFPPFFSLPISRPDAVSSRVDVTVCLCFVSSRLHQLRLTTQHKNGKVNGLKTSFFFTFFFFYFFFLMLVDGKVDGREDVVAVKKKKFGVNEG